MIGVFGLIGRIISPHGIKWTNCRKYGQSKFTIHLNGVGHYTWNGCLMVTEREGFEPSKRLLTL